MNDQRMTRGYAPYSPMPPQAGYRQAAPYGRYAMPPVHNRWMAAPYQGPMTAQPGNPAMSGKPATAAAPVKSAAQPALTAVSSDSKPAAETITVRISGMRFEPANLTVKPGTTVNWVQADRMPHTVSGKGNGLRSNTLQSGQTFSYTFKEAGVTIMPVIFTRPCRALLWSRKAAQASERQQGCQSTFSPEGKL